MNRFRGAWLWAAARLLTLFARRRRGPIQRVLLIRVDERVGNVLLTTPLIEALRALPIELCVVVARGKRAILPPDLRAIDFDKKAAFRSPVRFWSELRAVRRFRADAAIDASHWHELSSTASLLLAWSGAPIRIAHDRAGAAWAATHRVPIPAGPEVATKMALANPLAALLGVAPPSAGPMQTGLGRGGAAAERVREFLDGAPGSGPWLALLPGARKPDHRLPPELFRAAARAGQARGLRVLVLWGPDEIELAKAVVEGPTVLAPPTDLETLAAFLRSCALAIANDTGPMHLAVAVGTPTVGLFVAGDHERWGHAGPPNTVLDLAGLPLDRSIRRVEEAIAAASPRR